jgi:hypothetical protein
MNELIKAFDLPDDVRKAQGSNAVIYWLQFLASESENYRPLEHLRDLMTAAANLGASAVTLKYSKEHLANLSGLLTENIILMDAGLKIFVNIDEKMGRIVLSWEI